MIQTQLLKLDPPYNFIFCNGIIGKHIATLITCLPKTNESGQYSLETHSHPVVKYADSPDGVVWDKAELKECQVLCDETNKQISLDDFLKYSYYVHPTLLPIPGSAPNLSLSTVQAIEFNISLRSCGIAVKWPMLNIAGKERPQDSFEISLMFEKNPEGSARQYSCRTYGGSDIEFSGGVALGFYSDFDTKQDLEHQLQNFIGNYYTIFNDHQFKIVFTSFTKSEFDDVIDKVNKMENSLRYDADNPDV